MEEQAPQCVTKAGTNVVRIFNLSLSNVCQVKPKVSDVDGPTSQQKENAASSGISTGRWTKEEQLLFIKGSSSSPKFCLAMQKHGKQWALIKEEIPNRTAPQIRTHAQKFFIKLGRKVARNVDMLEFMKSKPASYFLRFDNPSANGSSSSEPSLEGENNKEESEHKGINKIKRKKANIKEEYSLVLN